MSAESSRSVRVRYKANVAETYWARSEAYLRQMFAQRWSQDVDLPEATLCYGGYWLVEEDE